ARLEQLERVGVGVRVHRRVLAEPERVGPVHVQQIRLARFVGAVGVGRLVRVAVDRPALWAALPAGLRILRGLAFAPVERGEVAAHAPRIVDDPAGVGLNAARANQLELLARWWLEDFGPAGLRRIRALLDPSQPLLIAANPRTPDAPILFVDGDRVAAEIDAMILGRVDGLIGFGPAFRNL